MLISGNFGLLRVRTVLVGTLHVFRTEVDQLFAEVNVLLVGVLIEGRKLCKLPLSALALLLFASLLLLGADFSALSFSLLRESLAIFSPGALFFFVLEAALSFLEHDLLDRLNPLDVFDESLLDLVVAHASVELFLKLVLLVFLKACLLQVFLNLHADVSQVVLLELLLLIVDALLRFLLRYPIFQRVYDLVCRVHGFFDSFTLLLQFVDVLPELFDLSKEGL